MNKKAKWLLTLSLATMITSSGIVMAATTADQQQGLKAGHPMGYHMKHAEKDHKALLELLKIDENTLRSEFKEGKTLGQIAAAHGVSEKKVIDLVKKQMTQRIEEGVKAGRITADQAKQMKADVAQKAEQMVKSGPGLRDGFGPGKMGHHPKGNEQDHKALLELLKIDENTLRSEFKAGKSLGQIATEHGVSEQAVIDLHKQHMTQRIEEGVKAGRLTAERAEQMKANMAQRAEEMVKSAPGSREGFGPGKAGFHGKHMMDHTALLELLKIDEATFKNELKEGKTLGQIAAAHGVSEQAVIDHMKQQMTQRIEEGVASGRLTAEQAEKMKADMAEKAEEMVKSGPKMMRKK